MVFKRLREKRQHYTYRLHVGREAKVADCQKSRPYAATLLCFWNPSEIKAAYNYDGRNRLNGNEDKCTKRRIE